MTHDILVIGGGSGGYAAAHTAAEGGANCALIESADTLGGTCILRGCMPSKALIEVANRCRAVREAAAFGVRLESPPSVDWPFVQERKDRLIADFQEHRRKELCAGRFDLIRGRARFTGRSTVEVSNSDGTTTLEARRIILAAGSKPNLPDIEGLDAVESHTSTSLLDLPRLPRHLVVLGAGSIGMEFAHCFEGLGCQVTIVQRSARLLTPFEPEVAEHLLNASRERGIEVLLEHELLRVAPRDGDIEFTVRGANATRTLVGDTLLFATGRRPCTDDLALHVPGVRTTGKHRIRIDRHCRTSNPEIFAVGDCASPIPVVHLAVIQGEVAATNALADLGLEDQLTDRSWYLAHRMTAIFTHPEAVQIGLTDEEADEQGIPNRTATYLFVDHGKAALKNLHHGFVKLVARTDNGMLIGASGVGESMIELSHAVMVAIQQGLSAETFAKVPHYHPTLAEIWLYPAEELAGADRGIR